ncbi:putative B-box zinc finger protein [Neospora caninum Liverpool]|uniref:Putative B-box zinc finger protein n=1 Tax=Neospora caninum (strain Liverpool) TaxID=572307 RepID=F0VE14_NEOCL|nr:putative B-box zinc finger protein [Neospora caninum Liverpool]CBZ51957.1 putative B-box zinc finger protein [Neospora caninum Liverpool]|eukprot:XP_003881990.1 putative B-box zinc finger protein [Neospora caninum Liverpool]
MASSTPPAAPPRGWASDAVASFSEAAHPTEDRPSRVNVSVIEDLQILAQWEYWIQLSLFTADLHIVGGWSLATPAQEQLFDAKARALKGPTVYSFLDLNELETPQSLENIIAEKRVKADWRKQIFPTAQCRPPFGFEGNPSGTFHVMVCKLALGSVLSKDRESGEPGDANFKTCDIPGEFTALSRREVDDGDRGATDNGANGVYRVLYRVKRAEQVLPTAVLEFEMKPLRIQVLQPVCEMCEALPATLYCVADRAQLCAQCDERVHSATRMLARHIRVPASHSPLQFGFCPYHPSEMIDSVCMTCFVALCPHCILIGSHSSADFSEHPLISTLDAYKMLMQDASPSEEALQERRRRIDRELVEKHRQLGQIHSNFLSVQKRIDEATKNLVGQLSAMKERKTNYLLAVKRELLSEMLVIEWMETFFAHLRLSLNPAEFLSYKHKFDLTMNVFLTRLGSRSRSDKMKGIGDSGTPDEDATRPLALCDKEGGSAPDAKWVSLPSEVEGLEEGRVCGHTKMPRFPDHARDQISIAEEGPIASAAEYIPTLEEATTDPRALPPETREMVAQAREADKRDESLPTLMQILSPLQKVPKAVCRRLWNLLSDNSFLPLLTLLKAADGEQRRRLVAAACNLANAASAVTDLANHLFQFELKWVTHLPASLFLHSSSLLFPFLSFVTSKEMLLPGDLSWLHQVMDPVLAAADSIVASENLTVDQILTETPAKLFRPAGRLFLERLQRLSLADFPCTFRGLLYRLADAVDAHLRESQVATFAPARRVTSPAIATCAETLICCFFGNFIIKYAPKRVVLGDGRDLRTDQTGDALFTDERTDLVGLRRMREIAERSRVPPVYGAMDKLLRQMASFCWEAINAPRRDGERSEGEGDRRGSDSLDAGAALRNVEEQFLAQAGREIVDWCSHQLKLPRLESPLKFSSAVLRKAADEATGEFLQYILRIDREMREGTFRSGTPGLTERDVATPAYEELLEFAIRASTYEDPSSQALSWR